MEAYFARLSDGLQEQIPYYDLYDNRPVGLQNLYDIGNISATESYNRWEEALWNRYLS